jgi:hypothetical protein
VCFACGGLEAYIDFSSLARAEIYEMVATLVMRYDWGFARDYELSDAFNGREAFVMHSKLDDVGFHVTVQKAV